jgi:hypothetical protein
MKKILPRTLLAFTAGAFLSHAEERSPDIKNIDERLEELAVIWRQEQAVINGFTKNRTVPVKEGTREYYACAKASGKIKLAEEEAAELKKKRLPLIEVAGESGTKNIRDAALSKMTKAEKLAEIEKLKKEIASDSESSAPNTESGQEDNMRDVGKPVIQAQEIKPETRPKLGDLSPLRKKLVGYWISVKEVKDPPTYELDKGVSENDLGEEAKLAKKVVENMKYSYACYGIDGFWTSGEWVPYDEIKEDGDIIEIKYWMKNVAFKKLLNQRVKISIENEIVELNAGGDFAYKRISEKEWIEKTQGTEWVIEDEAQEIKSKIPLSKVER